MNDRIVADEALLEPEFKPRAETTQDFRKEMTKISGQSGIYFIGGIAAAGITFFFKIYLARKLGPQLMGIYALGITVIAFLQLLGSLGLSGAVTRFVSVYKNTSQWQDLRGLLWRSLFLTCLANAGLAITLVLARDLIATRIFHVPALASYLPLFAFQLVLGALVTYFGAAVRGFQNVGRITLINTLIALPLTILLTVFFFTHGWNLGGYILAQVIGVAITAILLGWSVWRLTPEDSHSLLPPLQKLKPEVWKFSLSCILLGLLGSISRRADLVVVGIFLNASQVGIYSIAFATSIRIPFLLGAVNMIFGPVIAGLHARGDKTLLNRIFQTLTKWSFALTFPLVLVLIVFAPLIMRIFGPGFINGSPVLAIMAVGQLVNCATGSVGMLLLFSGNPNRQIRVQTFVAAVALALDFILIPVWGLTGAAIVSAFSLIATNVLYLREVWLALGLFPYNRAYVRLIGPLVASTGTVLVARWLMDVRHLNGYVILVFALIASYTIFALFSFLFALDEDDRLVGRAVSKRMRSVLSNYAIRPQG